MDPSQQQRQQRENLIRRTTDLAPVTSSVSFSCSSPTPTLPAECDNVAPIVDREQGEPASKTASVILPVDAQPLVPSPSEGSSENLANDAYRGLDRLEGYHELTDWGTLTATLPQLPPSPDETRSSCTILASSSSSSLFDKLSVRYPYEEGKPPLGLTGTTLSPMRWGWNAPFLDSLPNEILMNILTFLDVSDLLATSRTNHHFRSLSLHPILHAHRLRGVRAVLPPLLTSPSRPTLAELMSRHIFQTHTTQISRRLARNLAAIRLSRRLPQRPSAETLVQRGVLPPECVSVILAPGLVARKRAVERERLKDDLRKWVDRVWRGEVRERGEDVRKVDELKGVGRVWRLRRFWERVGKGSAVV